MADSIEKKNRILCIGSCDENRKFERMDTGVIIGAENER